MRPVTTRLESDVAKILHGIGDSTAATVLSVWPPLVAIDKVSHDSGVRQRSHIRNHFTGLPTLLPISGVEIKSPNNRARLDVAYNSFRKELTHKLANVNEAAEDYAQRDPDVRLMLQVRADDAAAFEQLVSRHQTRLMNFLFHLVGDRDRAEDLTQEVFLRIFRARKNYQPGAKFTTWMYTIATNTAKNAKRTLARRREVQWHGGGESGSQAIPALDQMAKAASGQMPTRQFDKAEKADIVRLAMQSLNERQRAAVLLCKFEGMSYTDIATTLEMTPSAVKSLLTRARSNLRDILHPYLSDGSTVNATKPAK